MVPADEFDIQKASLLRFFSHIEDDLVHRIAHILEANWRAIHLLTEDQSFVARISTYKKALAFNPDAAFEVERSNQFWQMLDGLRILRNAFAHGTQFFLQTEAGIRHVYSRAGPALDGRHEQAVDVEIMPLARSLASHAHVLVRCLVLEDKPSIEMAQKMAFSEWEEAKPMLPKGRSAKWPPKQNN